MFEIAKNASESTENDHYSKNFLQQFLCCLPVLPSPSFFQSLERVERIRTGYVVEFRELREIDTLKRELQGTVCSFT